MKPANTLDHVGLTVPNIDEATDFFKAILGAQVLFDLGPFQADDDWMTVNLGIDPRAVLTRLRMLALPSGAMLELFEYSGPGSETNVPLNSQVGGNHVAFFTDKIDAAVTALREIGAKVFGDVKTFTEGPAKGLQWVYFQAPWGQQLELVHHPLDWPNV
jgi:catechol 2,3-dioxygenase-like lactoylglutathione lyase family enzyme